ncbi:MAG: acyl-CoA dehydrogenase family protein [Pseudonocardiaceae bacterium]
MPIEFDHDPDVADLARRTATFVRDVVIPVEERHCGVTHIDSVRVGLQSAARNAGLFAPHVSPEYGGHGLGMRDRAPVFEEAGYSLLGPLALNVSAPDEGNMHMLELIATEEQKRRYLRPLVAGDVRSCFAMTEPAPGAGSDPAALTTRAEKCPAAGGSTATSGSSAAPTARPSRSAWPGPRALPASTAAPPCFWSMPATRA